MTRHMMAFFSSTTCSSLLLLLFVVVVFMADSVSSRKTSGDFVLSGVNSEQVMTSFALSAYARGWYDLSISMNQRYYNEHNLQLNLYTDQNWAQFNKATTCEEKIKLAKERHPLHFEYIKGTQVWSSLVAMQLNQEKEDRAHYWYFVVTDCSLEYHFRDGTLPKMEFTIQVWNDVAGKPKVTDLTDKNLHSSKKTVMTHFGADETGILTTHYITFALSTLICVLMILLIFNRMIDTHSVHLALFLVMTAAGCDAASSFCEIIHLRWYERNGFGWYLFDALSSHYEALCDSMVTLLLLAIASGWTMPTDVVQVSSSLQATWIQSLTQGLRSPMGALVQFNKAGVLVVFVFAAHLILAQWGRVYNDDFDSYHDLEHLPGKILMTIRIVLGLILVLVAMQSKASCSSPSLGRFYTILSLVGTLWFQGLPLVTWVCGWAVPYYLRHPTVTFYGGLCQTTSLLLLAWLVTAHSNSSFHKMSRMAQEGDGNLTDSLSDLGGLNGSSTKNRWSTDTVQAWESQGTTRLRL